MEKKRSALNSKTDFEIVRFENLIRFYKKILKKYIDLLGNKHKGLIDSHQHRLLEKFKRKIDI